jgi:hypothetical protein
VSTSPFQGNRKNDRNFHSKKKGELLERRQKKATELKQAVDTCERLKDDELLDLKADIKHFVSERKLDEDLGLKKRFDCDANKLFDSINLFGSIAKIEDHYSIANLNQLDMSLNSVSTISSSLCSASYQSSTEPSEKNSDISFEPANNISKANVSHLWLASRLVSVRLC